MPLRDHFDDAAMRAVSWDMVHGMLPMMIVLQLSEAMPERFVAGPIIRRGRTGECDFVAFEKGPADGRGEWPKNPTTSFETDCFDGDEYEVRICDQNRGRELVAAIEIVNPSNKDRPENRRAFVSRCRALLANNVCVSIIDLVTTRESNLYRDLRSELGYRGPAWEPAIYSVTCRTAGRRLDAWEYPLAIGQSLPTVPIWLPDEYRIDLDLEPSYEKTCKALRIR